MKYVAPSAKETAFNCPHCGALAKQHWSDIFVRYKGVKHPLPTIVGEGGADEFDLKELEDDLKRELTEWANRMAKGAPFLKFSKQRTAVHHTLHNVHLSTFYNCDKVSVWIYDRLTYPQTGEAPAANPDMPDDIRRDYDEASTILDRSPRGAAALIRLAIQKLCKELGQPGKNINRRTGEGRARPEGAAGA
ncbi:hypothetical protein [Aestuariicoccus sp. MJ-SS9]|uniref:hypothetical protein n=1 Tax=Aestuariicoccus sp. MJ-SS9 TaxID=3079855 RepID=UPI002907C3AC|nr:hypothetical protein [Aestuariicoccus sp. MJ-SS9]MDU8911429.1 hypothetical protein [Aestuariicoccus sp. MJ-SS9]